jgi:hypothetical protein
MVVPYQLIKAVSVLVKPIEGLMPENYTPDSLRAISGVTYWGDSGKAKRELGLKQRPFGEGWAETLRYETSRLETK